MTLGQHSGKAKFRECYINANKTSIYVVDAVDVVDVVDVVVVVDVWLRNSAGRFGGAHVDKQATDVEKYTYQTHKRTQRR
jgi:hypothetical protein